MEMHSGHLWEPVVFTPLFTKRRIWHFPAFMNACGSDILLVSHMCSLHEQRETSAVCRSDPCLPWQPTSNLHICPRGYAVMNIFIITYTPRGHNSQEVEFIHMWINSTCFKKEVKILILRYMLPFAASYDTISIMELLGEYIPGSKNKNQYRDQHFYSAPSSLKPVCTFSKCKKTVK